MKATDSYCTICGYEPSGKVIDPVNFLCRYWSPDDGWVIGALCIWCHKDYANRKPRPEDYAYDTCRHDVCSPDQELTDEDPMLAL